MRHLSHDALHTERGSLEFVIEFGGKLETRRVQGRKYILSILHSFQSLIH